MRSRVRGSKARARARACWSFASSSSWPEHRQDLSEEAAARLELLALVGDLRIREAARHDQVRGRDVRRPHETLERDLLVTAVDHELLRSLDSQVSIWFDRSHAHADRRDEIARAVRLSDVARAAVQG